MKYDVPRPEDIIMEWLPPLFPVVEMVEINLSLSLSFSLFHEGDIPKHEAQQDVRGVLEIPAA